MFRKSFVCETSIPKYFINIIVPCIHLPSEYYIDCVYEVKCYSYLVNTSQIHRVEGYENEQNFQYHLSYQICCKTKHMHDSVNVLLYKQYLKKRERLMLLHSLSSLFILWFSKGERANVLQCVEHTIMFKWWCRKGIYAH